MASSFRIVPYMRVLEGFESGGVDVFGVLGGLVVGDDGFACFEVNVRDCGSVDVDCVSVAGGAAEAVNVFPPEEY